MKLSVLYKTCQVAVFLLLSASAQAHEYYTASFKIIHPWSLATEPGITVAEVYLTFEEVVVADRLIGARSNVAKKVEIRNAAVMETTAISSGKPVLATLPMKAVSIAPGSTVELAPGGIHLLMTDLNTPLLEGRSYPLTLIFEKGGEIDTMLSIGAH